MEPKNENSQKRPALGGLLTGSFLTSKKWEKNWPFILYLSLLTLIMIASSHSADRKVHRLSSLRSQVKDLSSQYIDIHSRLMNESMETKVVNQAEALGLEKSPHPPKLIIYKEKEE